MRTFNASIGHSRKKVKPETSASHRGSHFSTLSLDEKLDSIVTFVHELSTKMSELTSILHHHNTRWDMKFTSLQTQLDQIQRQLEENIQLFHDKKGECQLDQKMRKLSKGEIFSKQFKHFFQLLFSVSLCLCTHVAFVSFQGYVLYIVCRPYGVYHAFMQPLYIVLISTSN